VEAMFVCMAVLLWPTVSDTIICHIFMKIGLGVLYINLLSWLEFRENWFSDGLICFRA